MFNQGFRSLNNVLFKGFVLLALGIQRRLKLFQQVVEPFLNRAIVAKFHGPGRFPLFACGLMYAFSRFPVNVIPVGVVEERAQLIANRLAGFQVCLFQPGLGREIGLAGLIRLIRGLLEP